MNDKQMKELTYLIATSIHGKCEHCKARGICDICSPLDGPYDCAHMW